MALWPSRAVRKYEPDPVCGASPGCSSPARWRSGSPAPRRSAPAGMPGGTPETADSPCGRRRLSAGDHDGRAAGVIIVCSYCADRLPRTPPASSRLQFADGAAARGQEGSMVMTMPSCSTVCPQGRIARDVVRRFVQGAPDAMAAEVLDHPEAVRLGGPLDRRGDAVDGIPARATSWLRPARCVPRGRGAISAAWPVAPPVPPVSA